MHLVDPESPHASLRTLLSKDGTVRTLAHGWSNPLVLHQNTTSGLLNSLCRKVMLRDDSRYRCNQEPLNQQEGSVYSSRFVEIPLPVLLEHLHRHVHLPTASAANCWVLSHQAGAKSLSQTTCDIETTSQFFSG